MTAPSPTVAGVLSNSAASVLGMVSLGARSGYEIRRAAERSLRFFWALGPPQIYSELRRLEEAGLLSGFDDARGNRPRRSFEITDAGRDALREWLTSSEPSSLEMRDGEMLRLFDKVASTYRDHVLTFDMGLPTWPFFAVAWIGDVSAVLLIAIRTYRLIFHPEDIHDVKSAA